jgi:Flp pilus assembly protein TadD
VQRERRLQRITGGEQSRFAVRRLHYPENSDVGLQSALAINQKALPEGHPDIAQVINQLAAINQSEGRFPEAEALYKQALEMQTKTLPNNHRMIAVSFGNLSMLSAAQEDWQQALTYLRKATAIYDARIRMGRHD